MSLAQIIEISCDAPGCDETFTADGVGRIEARRLARGGGWTYPRRPGSAPVPDLCPAHSRRPTVMLPCTLCGEPVEAPAGATAASHGRACVIARESRERMTRRA